MTQGPPRYHGLDHVVLCVTNPARSVDFYTRVLGMSLERIIEDFGIWQVRCGRHLIDLKQVAALAPVAERGVDHLCLLIDGPVTPLLEYLRGEGVTVTWGPIELYGATGFGTSVYVLDPDGHTLELKADHAEAPLRTTGRDAAATLTRDPVAPRR